MLKWSKKVHGITFKISSEYKYAELEVSNGFQPKNINIKWNRHGQTVDSKQNDEVKWENSPEEGQNTWLFEFPAKTESTLEITLFKSKKTVSYEHAHCRYTLETKIEGKWKTIATADIDLAEHLKTNTLMTKLKIELEPKQKYIKKGMLYLDLNFEHIHSDNVTQKSSTFPRNKNANNQIIEVLKRCNDDVITIGASNQPDLCEILNKEVILVANQLPEIPSDLWKLLKKYETKCKANKHFQLIFVGFAQSNEELTETVKEEKLEFPVLKGSQELKTLLEQLTEVENSISVLVLTTEGEISDNIPGLDSVREYFEKRMSLNFGDSISLSNYSLSSRRTIPKDLLSEKLSEKESIIEVLEEEKESLKSENEQLQQTLTDIQSAVAKNSNLQREHLETEENLEYKTKILQAERDVRTTLNKRGVSGMTGKKMRTRCFSFESDSICYYDPGSNKMKGQFSVLDIVSMEIAPASKQDKNGVIFLVRTPNRVYEIQAMNDVQMENWITAVEVLKGVVSERKHRKDTM